MLPPQEIYIANYPHTIMRQIHTSCKTFCIMPKNSIRSNLSYNLPKNVSDKSVKTNKYSTKKSNKTC